MLESGGPGEPYPFVFWPVTEVWALALGIINVGRTTRQQHQHQQQQPNTLSNTSIISGSHYSYLNSL